MTKKPGLDLMSRDAFAALTLHEKNSYLQELAKSFANANNRNYLPLDKDALSRLRRYYSRRVFADLQLDGKPDTGLNARKQKRTLKQLHVDLVALGFTGSYNRVAAFARDWRAERSREQQTAGPSVPMMMRQRPAGSLPLRAEVIASDGYARFASRKDSCRIWPRN